MPFCVLHIAINISLQPINRIENLSIYSMRGDGIKYKNFGRVIARAPIKNKSSVYKRGVCALEPKLQGECFRHDRAGVSVEHDVRSSTTGKIHSFSIQNRTSPIRAVEASNHIGCDKS